MDKTLDNIIDEIDINQRFEKEYKEAKEQAKYNNKPFLYEEEYDSIKNLLAIEIVGENFDTQEVAGDKFFDYVDKCKELIANKIELGFKNSETLICDSTEFWLLVYNEIKEQLSKEVEYKLSDEIATSDFVQMIINHNNEKSKIYFHNENIYDYSELDIDTIYAQEIKKVKEKIDMERMKDRIVNMQKERMKSILFYTSLNDFYEENEEHQFICVLLDRIYHFLVRNNLNISVETFTYILNVLLIDIDDKYISIYTNDIEKLNIDYQWEKKVNVSTFLFDKEINKVGENEIYMIDTLVGSCISYLNGFRD
ncbi:hypothetical protein Q0M83_13060 [Staphylococcus aureus]|nr:hypothetical protein [Staphylococcus aureus]